MKSVLAFVVVAAVLALVVGSTFASGCASTPQYTLNLKLACQGNELNFNWPNYKNVSQFYACQVVGRPLLLTCAADTYFSYYLQACQSCDKYIPSQPCDTLKTEKGSSCQAMNGRSMEPTPIYPTGAQPTTTVVAITTTTEKAPTTTTTTTQGRSTTAFPPAPSPSTVDPSVPTPITAAPTPPLGVIKPPTVVLD